jgi:hypothetical protein
MDKLPSELAVRLVSMGLGMYLGVLANHGFDTWETVMEITLKDLGELLFKLGHQRRLMRAIASYQGYPLLEPLPETYSGEDSATAIFRHRLDAFNLEFVVSFSKLVSEENNGATINEVK